MAALYVPVVTLQGIAQICIIILTKLRAEFVQWDLALATRRFTRS